MHPDFCLLSCEGSDKNVVWEIPTYGHRAKVSEGDFQTLHTFEGLWYVWPCNSTCLKHFIFFYTKTCFKGRKYFKDLCRSEMTANSQWVKFSALAMFSLYIRDMLMGQELLSGQLAKAAGLCAALLAVVLWGQGRCAIYSLEWDNESEAAWKKLMQFSVRTYFLIQKVLAKSSGIWPWLPL